MVKMSKESRTENDAPGRYKHPHRGALNAHRVEAMRRADARGECYITPDGWCATHSTSDGPAYCVIPPGSDHP